MSEKLLLFSISVDEESSETDELVLVAVQEGVTIASPFNPNLEIDGTRFNACAAESGISKGVIHE